MTMGQSAFAGSNGPIRAQVPAWQWMIILLLVALWLCLGPGALFVYYQTGKADDLYGAGFVLTALVSGAAWLGVGVPLAVLSLVNGRRWDAALHVLALMPLLTLLLVGFCYTGYALIHLLGAGP
jgi:hypothetical protein